jgi:hypothetical protein
MPKGHSIIGAQRALIKRMGTQGRGVTVTASVAGSPTNVASIFVEGLTLGDLTQSQKDAFKAEFATKLGVSVDMIILTFKSGSLILDVSVDSSKISTKDDNAFIVNAPAVLAQLTNTDINDIITNSGTSASITGTANIDHARTVVTVNVNLQNQCLQRHPKREIYNPIVGDDDNNCMYTILNSKIVRIFPNGSTDTICNFPEDNIRYIFITNDGDYLVIPSNIFSQDNVNPLGQSNLPYQAGHTNKIYIVCLTTKTVFTNNTQKEFYYRLGFNKFNNTIYYSSAETATYSDNYMSTIVFSNSNIPSIISNIPSLVDNNVIFTDVSNGFSSSRFGIVKINTSTSSFTYIAGQGDIYDYGIWNNVPLTTTGSNDWYNGSGSVYGPFSDNSIGLNAWFTITLGGLVIDSVNNRILVADDYSQRIRSIDLTPGNNYAVTTLAGTSPIKYGAAINGPQTSYSPQVLDSLGQVGIWNNPISGMPRFSKVNSSYATSTFNNPHSICLFDNKILVLDYTGTRVLSNGRVNDFTVMGQ